MLSNAGFGALLAPIIAQIASGALAGQPAADAITTALNQWASTTALAGQVVDQNSKVQALLTSFLALGLKGTVATAANLPTAASAKVEGATYIALDTGVGYACIQGQWTSVGVIRGPAGASILKGQGAPSASTGSLGDTYLDLSAGDFWYKDVAGWEGPVAQTAMASLLAQAVAAQTGAQAALAAAANKASFADSRAMAADGSASVASAKADLASGYAGNAQTSQSAAAGSATATAADRVQTGQDRQATGASASAAAGSASAAAGSATATAADRAQTGQDRTATGASASAAAGSATSAGQAATATAADRVQTGKDVTTTSGYAANAQASQDQSAASASTAGAARDQAVAAKNAIGALAIGTVSTLAPGASATAGVDQSTPAAPKLNLGIPQGAKGDTGSTGPQGAQGNPGSGTSYSADSSTTANAIVASVTPSFSTISDGVQVYVKVASTNTGPVTANLSGTGAKAVTSRGLALQGGELIAGGVYTLVGKSGAWELQSDVRPLVGTAGADRQTLGGVDATTTRGYAHRGIAAAATIFAAALVITVRGYAAEGDCKPHSYARLSQAPATVQPWHFKDALGAYWQLAERELTHEMFGVKMDMASFACTSVSGQLSQLTYTSGVDLNGIPVLPQVGQTINVPGGAGSGRLGGQMAIYGNTAPPIVSLPLVTTIVAVDTVNKIITMAAPVAAAVSAVGCTVFTEASAGIITSLAAGVALGRPVVGEQGVYGCTSPLVQGSAAVLTGPGGLEFRGRGASRPDAASPIGGGTAYRFFGSSFTSLLTVYATAWRNCDYKGFTLIANEPGAAKDGFVFPIAAFSSPKMERLNVAGAVRSYALYGGGGGNGEFIYSLKCAGDGDRYFFQDSAAGQSFDHMFVEPQGSLANSGNAPQLGPIAAFEIGGSGGGYGLKVINPSFSFYGNTTQLSTAALFAAAQPSILLLNNGVTGDVSFDGGRVEKCSTLVRDTGGNSGFRSTVSWRNLSMVGMPSSAARPIFDCQATSAYYKYTVRECNLSGWTTVPASLVNVVSSQQQLLYDRCNFDSFDARYDTITGGGTAALPLSGEIEYIRCGLTRTGGGLVSELLDGKVGSEGYGALMRRRAMDGVSYGTPSNVLIYPDFNRAPSGVPAPPWYTTDGAALAGIQRSPTGTINAYSTAPYACSASLAKSQGVYQDIPSATLPFTSLTGINQFFYQARVRVAGSVTFKLFNPTTGRVYDQRTYVGNNLTVEPDLVSLRGVEATGSAGNVRLLIQNNSSASGAGVIFENQLLSQKDDATFLNTSAGAAKTLSHPWATLDNTRVNGRLALPHYADTFGAGQAGLADLESDHYLSATTERHTYAADVTPVSDAVAGGAFWITERVRVSATMPTSPPGNAYRNGDRVMKPVAVAGSSPGWRCTTALTNTLSYACTRAWAAGIISTTLITQATSYVANGGYVYQQTAAVTWANGVAYAAGQVLAGTGSAYVYQLSYAQAAWAAGSYASGSKVTSNGYLFNCTTAGAGSSSIAPTLATSGQTLSDGYVWTVVPASVLPSVGSGATTGSDGYTWTVLASTTAPTHTSGSVTEPDGVTWSCLGLQASFQVLPSEGWQTKTAAYPAADGDRIMADTSSAAFAVTLPASPALGATVELRDPKGSWMTKSPTINLNGSTYKGGSTAPTLMTAYGVERLVYSGTTWVDG